MKHASLFSGIGGFDLAASWMGWENTLQCEIDPFCQKILRYHFPNAKLYDDIRTLNGNEWKGKIDILTGGFPCQPFSQSGKRMGKGDDRFLWPEMLRIIQEIQPIFVLGENVSGIATIESKLVFKNLLTDLEANGYEAQPFCIPACAVGACHRRDRIWFFAYSDSIRRERGKNGEHEENGGWKGSAKIKYERCDKRTLRGEEWPSISTAFCGVGNGLPGELDGITIPKWRRESLKAYGNAIVPQVAYQIFLSIAKVYDH